MKWYEILLLILVLLPLAAYLRSQTYRSRYGKATIRKDLSRLRENIRNRIRDRKERTGEK